MHRHDRWSSIEKRPPPKLGVWFEDESVGIGLSVSWPLGTVHCQQGHLYAWNGRCLFVHLTLISVRISLMFPIGRAYA